jgi:hypothetical protein
MSAKGGSSLTTVLFSIPLAAIPLMAIFGIPQFAPVVASPDPGEASLDDRAALGDPSGDYRRRASDLMQPYEDRGLSQPLSDAPAYGTEHAQLAAHTEPAGGAAEPLRPQGFADPAATADEDWKQQQPAGAANRSDPFMEQWANAEAPAAAADSGRASAPTADSSGLTWREAARKLSEMGIDDYHLERGEADGTFLFVCSFAPAGATNVSMRFEAESDEPLVAVGDVLAQVDRWLRQRYAQSTNAPAPTR